MVNVQRAFRAKYANVFPPPLPCDLADLKARIIAAVKNIDAPMLTRVWQENEYRIDVWMCAVSPVVAVNSSPAFGFLVINVCNYGEHYETPCI